LIRLLTHRWIDPSKRTNLDTGWFASEGDICIQNATGQWIKMLAQDERARAIVKYCIEHGATVQPVARAYRQQRTRKLGHGVIAALDHARIKRKGRWGVWPDQILLQGR
jgi:hypothetical protein